MTVIQRRADGSRCLHKQHLTHYPWKPQGYKACMPVAMTDSQTNSYVNCKRDPKMSAKYFSLMKMNVSFTWDGFLVFFYPRGCLEKASDPRRDTMSIGNPWGGVNSFDIKMVKTLTKYPFSISLLAGCTCHLDMQLCHCGWQQTPENGDLWPPSGWFIPFVCILHYVCSSTYFGKYIDPVLNLSLVTGHKGDLFCTPFVTFSLGIYPMVITLGTTV